MEMGIYFGSAPFPPASLLALDRCLLWHGWLLVLAAPVRGIFGLLHLVNWPAWSFNVAWVLIPWIVLGTGLRLIVGKLMIFPWKCLILPDIWTDGSREDFSLIGGFEVAGAGVYVPAPDACL